MAAPSPADISNFCVVVESKFAQVSRKKLELEGLWDSKRRLVKTDIGKIGIPVISSSHVVTYLQAHNGLPVVISNETTVVPAVLSTSEPIASKKSQLKTPHQKLVQNITELLSSYSALLTDELKNEIPIHWEKHGDLILLPETAFLSLFWKKFGKELWEKVCLALNCKKIGRKSSITPDEYRSSSVELLHGDDGWVEHIDNGIRYCFDVTKCMFSIGNITEKLRIAKLDCSRETIVDLYAGIGYFTLPYLVHAKAHFVYACEWNPHAVVALQKNLDLNGCSSRCEILQGDNRQVCPKNVADRVNLGLIPSSEDGWHTACQCLRSQTGGVLHIHNNVTTGISKSNTKSINIDFSEPMDVIHSLNGELETCATLKNRNVCADNPDGARNSLCGDCLNNDWHAPLQEDCNDSVDSLKVQANDKHNKRDTWKAWSKETAEKIKSILETLHPTLWTVKILHIEHVKSYAPHIDHIVLDLDCKPKC